MSSWKLYLYKLITLVLPETRFFGLKVSLLRWSGAKIGQKVRICSSASISGAGNLVLGDDVWIGPGCFIAAGSPATITIGSSVDIAPGTYISTGSHDVDAVGAHTAGKGYNRDITIADGVWIGARAVILPGVTIGKKALIGAGAIVLKSIDGMKVAVGNPARIIHGVGD